MSKSY